jgi:hypothetical protein
MGFPQRDPNSAPVVPLEVRAGENLRFIRETIERSASFHAIPGWGGIALGATGLAAAILAAQAPSAAQWVGIWLLAACVACPAGLAAVVQSARRARVSLLAVPGRRFALVFAAPLLAGGLLTAALYREGAVALLPGTWLLLYGIALVSGGTLSVSLVRRMGYGFLLLGAPALFVPLPQGNWLLGCGFGALQIVFGILLVRRRHG